MKLVERKFLVRNRMFVIVSVVASTATATTHNKENITKPDRKAKQNQIDRRIKN